jgi:hypothetical protein
MVELANNFNVGIPEHVKKRMNYKQSIRALQNHERLLWLNSPPPTLDNPMGMPGIQSAKIQRRRNYWWHLWMDKWVRKHST